MYLFSVLPLLAGHLHTVLGYRQISDTSRFLSDLHGALTGAWEQHITDETSLLTEYRRRGILPFIQDGP